VDWRRSRECKEREPKAERCGMQPHCEQPHQARVRRFQ
jgi:hypothetical protein